MGQQVGTDSSAGTSLGQAAPGALGGLPRSERIGQGRVSDQGFPAKLVLASTGMLGRMGLVGELSTAPHPTLNLLFFL